MLYPHEICKCRTCGSEIAFVFADGRNYPVDVDRSSGLPEVASNERHRCPYTREQILSIIALFEVQLAEAEEAVAAGDWYDGRDFYRQAIQIWEHKLEILEAK